MLNIIEDSLGKISTQLFERSNNAILIINAKNGDILKANYFCELLLGYEIQQLENMNITDLTNDQENLSNLVNNDLYQIIKSTWRCNNNNLVQVEMNIHKIDQYIVYIVRNISKEYKQYQDITRLSSIIEKATDAIAISNKHGYFTYLNPAGRKLLGYDKHENIEKNKVYNHATSRTIELLFKTAIPHAINHHHWHGKTQFHTVFGIVNTSQTIVCHKDSNDKISYFSSIIRDLSNESEKQYKINETLALLAEAEKIAHLGSWQYSFEKKILTWSKGFYRVLNMNSKLKPSFKLYLKHVSRLDRHKILTAIKSADTQPIDILHQLITASGKIKWLRVTGFLQYDKSGSCKYFTGTIQDVTTRKTQNKALELAYNVINNTTEAVMVTDENNKILQINKAFEKITGYNIDELIGQSPALLSSHKHDEAFYQKMWGSINQTGGWQGEIWNKRKSGEIYPEWLTIDTIYDEQKKVTNRIAVFSDITIPKEQANLINHQAKFDKLTNLPNRTLLLERLDITIKFAVRHKSEFAVIFIDLDMFKSINDNYGHDIGDLVLIETASRLTRNVRKCDVVSRLGGDEFVIIANDSNGVASIDNLTRNLILAIQEPMYIRDYQFHLTMSLGVALFPLDSQNSTELVSLADQAMYFSKALGRNQCQFFTRSLAEQSKRKMEIKEALIIAIKKQELYTVYQPIVNITSGEIVKFEVLARWFSSYLNQQISPAEFISIAEDFGLIEEIGEQIARQAIMDIKQLNNKFKSNFGIAINRSVREFNGNQVGVTKLEQLVEEYQLPLQWLTVEITESIFVDNHIEQASLLQYWRDIGASTAIDDFGTGYSSLSYLTNFPIDIVKIDQSFIKNLNLNNHKVVDAIIGLSHSLGLTNIAEGVETREQLTILSALKCDMVQGYFISKPLIYNDLIDFINSYKPIST